MLRTVQLTKRVLVVTALGCVFTIVLTTGNRAGTAASSPAPPDAAADYKAKCASCHGADGAGQTAAGKRLKVKAIGSPEVQAMSDDQLYAIIAKGKGKMPAYEKTLGAARCKALVAHMRTFKK
jgi:mono/diheme cytochrome c family protein